MGRRAALVFNPVAGGPSSPPLDELTRRLEKHFELSVLETTPDRDADVCAREAVERGAELVIAAGGDGTTSLVASALIGHDAVMGVLPCGTANSVADALDIPGDLDGACENLVTGIPRWLDTAQCGSRTMLLACTIGFHADTVDDASREQKNRWGILAYVASGLKRLLDMEAFEVELETEAHRLHGRVTSVAIANLAPPKSLVSQGPAFIRPDDGLLDVTMLAASGLVDAIATGFHLLRTATQGEPATRDQIGYFACQRVRVTTTPPKRVVLDGEPIGDTPVELVCRPRSLRVMVPELPPAEPPSPEADLSGLPDVEIERK